jgi:hypothetical protein
MFAFPPSFGVILPTTAAITVTIDMIMTVTYSIMIIINQ